MSKLKDDLCAWRIFPHAFTLTLVLQAVVWAVGTTQNCLLSYPACYPKLSGILRGILNQLITIHIYYL